MRKRGRPSEQLKRETSFGRVSATIFKLLDDGDYTKRVRDVATITGYSPSAVGKLAVWKQYALAKKEFGHRIQQVEGRRMSRPAAIVESRVIQVVAYALDRGDYSLTVRGIASIIGRSRSAVAKTRTWKGYVQVCAREKESRVRKPGSKGRAQ